jgi:hypothetical protein
MNRFHCFTPLLNLSFSYLITKFDGRQGVIKKLGLDSKMITVHSPHHDGSKFLAKYEKKVKNVAQMSPRQVF